MAMFNSYVSLPEDRAMQLRQTHAYPVRTAQPVTRPASTSGSSRPGMPEIERVTWSAFVTFLKSVVEQYIVNMMHVIHTHIYIYIYIHICVYMYIVNKMNNYRNMKYLINLSLS